MIYQIHHETKPAAYEGNEEAKSTSDYPDDSIIRLNVVEEPDFFNAEWADMELGPQIFETGITSKFYVT